MGKFLTGLAIGLAAGATVALIFAPQAGVRTRRQLRRGFQDAGERLRDTAGTVGDRANSYYKMSRDAVNDVVDSAQSVVTAAKRVVSFG